MTGEVYKKLVQTEKILALIEKADMALTKQEVEQILGIRFRNMPKGLKSEYLKNRLNFGWIFPHAKVFYVREEQLEARIEAIKKSLPFIYQKVL